MAFDGNGDFQLPSPQYPFINGTTITAEDMNEILAEIAGALSICITRDNSGKPATTISWNGQKLTQLGTGTTDTDAVNYGQVFKSPTFQGPKAQQSPAQGDNSLLLATTEYVMRVAFSTALPGQANNAGKLLSTDGTTATWVTLQLDSRGESNSAKGNVGANLALDFSAAETYSLTPTANGIQLTFTGWVANRVCVMMVALTNAGLHPPTFVGVNWIKPDGSETATFADLGIAFQNAGVDRVMVVSEPGRTPWAKVVR